MSIFRRRLLQQALAVPKPIASYECYDLTNEGMAENPVLTDLTGNGHDITCHNFAWGGMSGIGGYPDNLRNYQINDYDGLVTEVVNDHKFTINGNIGLEHYYQVLSNRSDYSAKRGSLYAKGVPDGLYFIYQINGSTPNPEAGIKIKNGLNEFDLKTNETSNFMKFQIANQTGAIIENVNIEIEFLPLHKGALVSDGVDDYGICENFPILTKEKGYTVVALRKHYDFRNNQVLCSKYPEVSQGEFVFDQIDNYGNFSGFNFGASISTNVPSVNEELFIYQTSKNWNGISISIGNATIFNNDFYLFDIRNGGGYKSCVALYALEIYDEMLRKHQAQLSDLQRTVETAESLYQWSTKMTYLEVLTARQSLLTAQLNVVSDKYNLLQTTVNLYRSLGGGRQ